MCKANKPNKYFRKGPRRRREGRKGPWDEHCVHLPQVQTEPHGNLIRSDAHTLYTLLSPRLSPPFPSPPRCCHTTGEGGRAHGQGARRREMTTHTSNILPKALDKWHHIPPPSLSPPGCGRRRRTRCWTMWSLVQAGLDVLNARCIRCAATPRHAVLGCGCRHSAYIVQYRVPPYASSPLCPALSSCTLYTGSVPDEAA